MKADAEPPRNMSSFKVAAFVNNAWSYRFKFPIIMTSPAPPQDSARVGCVVSILTSDDVDCVQGQAGPERVVSRLVMVDFQFLRW